MREPWQPEAMTRLRLVGPSDDGQHLIVATPDDQQFVLPVSEDLRKAVRHARTAVQATTDPRGEGPTMSPKVIQQRIRAGLNAAELSELTGQSRELLEKYEAPVLAERTYVADLARTTRIGREGGAPVLGDLVADRLAGRGVDVSLLRWDAWREDGEPWHVCVDFPIGDRSVRAEWAFDHTARAVTALDEEARWLTETELLDVPIPKRHLASVRDQEATAREEPDALKESRPVSALSTVSSQTGHDAPQSSELFLEDLNGRRGTRDPISMDGDSHEDSDFEGFGPAAASHKREAEVGFNTLPPPRLPHPAGSSREESSEGTTQTPAKGVKKPSKKGRASVPSWDEIVFGAKND